MKKFEFRLQKVLEYREISEGWARDRYIAARAERLEAEATLAAIERRRLETVRGGAGSLDERLILERLLERMDDETRATKAALGVLCDEEAKAFLEWQARKQELKAMQKLREKAETEFRLEMSRLEQAALDEWATLRRQAVA